VNPKDVTETRPEKYWHCYVQVIGLKTYAVCNDLSFDDLQRQMIDPWHRGVRFPVAGLIVPSRDQVQKIRITHTPQPKEHYAQEFNYRRRSAGINDMSTDRQMLPIWHGADHTHELLFASLQGSVPEPEVSLVLRLCERLHAAARILAKRRQGKDPFEITDEYDAQDLLHAVLRAYLKYTVHEEPLGKVGGGHSGRADIAIEELGAVVELKYVHGPDDQRRVVDEFSNDLLLYTKWPHLKHFIYLVYNSQDLRDPEALDKLAGPCSLNGVSFTTHVVRA
jgi:hypothetical protein